MSDDENAKTEIDPAESCDTALGATAESSPENRLRKQADDDPIVGESLDGRYRVKQRIGRGGMGLVYEARHEELDKRVAVKIIVGELANNPETLTRFKREAKAAASLDPEHIIDVIDYGTTETGTTFMVMELLEGATLEQEVLRNGPMATGRATAITRQIAKGLVAAHAAGIVHRDLKTANVFLLERDDRDHVKVLDFGISKVSGTLEEDVKLTSTGAVVGTPNYMSPEQAQGRSDLDHRIDIYALGVILYEMLVGDVPFIGENFLEVAYKHISVDPKPPSQVRPDLDIPRELDAIVMCCMHKNPDKRYQSAQELIEALPEPSTMPGGWSSGGHISMNTVPPAADRTRSRHRALIAAGVIGALIIAAFVVGFVARDPELPPLPIPGQGQVGPDATPAVATRPVAHSAGDADAAGGDHTTMAMSTDAATADSPAKNVTIRLVPSPVTAKVYVNGESLGTGPQTLQVAPGSKTFEVEAKARGFRPARQSVTPTEDVAIELELTPQSGGSRPATTAPIETPPPDETPPTKRPANQSGSGDIRQSPYGQNR